MVPQLGKAISQTTSPLLATHRQRRTHGRHQHGTIVLAHTRVALVDAQAFESVEGLSAGLTDLDVGFGGHYYYIYLGVALGAIIKKGPQQYCRGPFCGPTWNRTKDLLIMSQLL